MLLALRNQPFQFSGKMSDSGEQGATISGQVSDSDEQKPPISPQLPDFSEQEAQDSEENPDSSEDGQDSEENPDSGESAPTPENTPDSSVGETTGEKMFDFEDVKAALSETIPVFGEEKAQVKPLKINFNSHASGSGEANEAEAPMPDKPSTFMPNPPSLIEDSDEKAYHGQQEASNPDEQETDSSDSGEQEVQSAAPTVITLHPADWKKAVSEKAKAEEEEENQKEVVPELIHNITVQQAELKERGVAHPSLLGGSSKNPNSPAAVQKPDSQPNESAPENVELGKRKVDERGKGKVEENQEDGGAEVSEEEEAASPKSKKPKKNVPLPPGTAVTKPDSQPSESTAEKKRKIGEKGKGSKEEGKQEGGGEEESEEDETAGPKSNKLKNA